MPVAKNSDNAEKRQEAGENEPQSGHPEVKEEPQKQPIRLCPSWAPCVLAPKWAWHSGGAGPLCSVTPSSAFALPGKAHSP